MKSFEHISAKTKGNNIMSHILHRLPTKFRAFMFVAIAMVAVLGLVASPYGSTSVKAACSSGCVASMSATPSSGSYNPGNTLTVSVYVNSGGQGVNAVQADFTYPASLLQFQSINPSGSAFSIDAASSGGSGSVSIARGNISAVSGSNLLVAQVTFQVLSAGTASITFSGSSAVVSSSSNQDILNTKSGASYTISNPAPPAPPPSSGSDSGSSGGGSAPTTSTPSSGGVNKKPAPPSSSQPSSSTPAPDANTPSTPAPESDTPATPATDTQQPAAKKSNWLPTVGLVAGAVVALGAVGAAAWWMLRHRGSGLPKIGGTVPSTDFITGTSHPATDHHNDPRPPVGPGH
jgi:hypothetical protein